MYPGAAIFSMDLTISRLGKIKRKFDPGDPFIVGAAVGSGIVWACAG